MHLGVITSGLFHALFILLLLINLEGIIIKREEIVKSVDVGIISAKDYDAMISDKKSQESRPLEASTKGFEKPVSEIGILKDTDKVIKQRMGNEFKGISEPEIGKVKKRKTTGEIITENAQSGQGGENHTENLNFSLRAFQKETKIEKKNQKRASTTTTISPEGTNVAIVSGAIEYSKLPLNKPNNFAREKADNSKEKKISSSVYDQLVDQVAKEESFTEIKKSNNPMQNLAKSKMVEKLNSNWNVVSINRLPNFEKYVIILEIPLNSRGNIMGTIKTVYPKSVEGNFLIAKRSAINAVLDSLPFQVPREFFPNGLILRVVFDPKTNIGVNNG